jgi:hypothetical protein
LLGITLTATIAIRLATDEDLFCSLCCMPTIEPRRNCSNNLLNQ